MKPGLTWVLAAAAALGCSRGASEEEIAPEVPVQVAPLVQATLHHYVLAYGTVEPEPARDGRPAAGAVISPMNGGILASVNAVEGQRVERGAVLFRLESRLADVAVEKAKQELQFAEQGYTRQQELLRSEVTSQRAVEEARQRRDDARSGVAAAETARGFLDIRAPMSGIIMRITARVGQSVDPATVLASVIDTGRLVVAAEVPSPEAATLRTGQRVMIASDSLVRGTIILVGQAADPTNDTRRVLASVPAGSKLIPGSFVDLRIETEERRNVLAAPLVALVTRPSEGSWLMVVRGDSAIRTAAVPGLRDGQLVEVSGAGLAPGTRVVTVEAYSLPAATKIKIAGR